MGALALQLTACGDLLSTGSETGLHDPARPEPFNDGATAELPARPVADEVQTVVVHKPHGVAVVKSDAQPGAPEEPAPMTDTGWETTRCAGAPTRRVSMTANLDASVFQPWFETTFNAEDPFNTATFGSSFTAFDDQGRAQVVSVFFGRAQDGWDYHALMDGSAFIVGAGHLGFDDQGIVTSIEEREPLRLLTAHGPGHVVELDLTGMTQQAGPFVVNAQEVDGSEARWGTTCASAALLPTAAEVAGPQCAAVATTRLALRANLAAGTPITNAAWDPLAPAADYTLPLHASDAQGTPIDFELGLRKASAETWEYHVLLAGTVPEVASGSLRFNPNGSLHSVSTTRTLRFPNNEGVLGAPIALDFGASTDGGGNGLDGVTSLPGGSFGVWQQSDGAALDCLPRAITAPLPAQHAPSCAGERTTAVSMYFNLDPRWPQYDGTAYAANVSVLDAELEPQQLELRFEHLTLMRWRCRVFAASAEVGVVDLHFTDNGAPKLVDNIPVLRLPLSDGSAGPPIELAFDASWSITSFVSENYGWLQPNGAAPGADGCVD